MICTKVIRNVDQSILDDLETTVTAPEVMPEQTNDVIDTGEINEPTA